MDIQTLINGEVTPAVAFEAYAETGFETAFHTFEGENDQNCLVTTLAAACFPRETLYGARRKLQDKLGAGRYTGLWRGFDNAIKVSKGSPAYAREYAEGYAEGQQCREAILHGQKMDAELEALAEVEADWGTGSRSSFKKNALALSTEALAAESRNQPLVVG